MFSSEEEYKFLRYINELTLVSLLYLFSLWRYSRSKAYTSNKNKRKLRVLGGLLISASIMCTLLYNVIIVLVSRIADIDKYDFELSGFSEYKFDFYLGNLKINSIEIMNVAYICSNIFRISSIYVLIGLWGPCLYSSINSHTELINELKSNDNRIYISKNFFQSYIIIFSKVYAMLRIPFILCGYFKLRNLSLSQSVFFESMYLGLEIYISIGLFLILKTKHNIFLESKGIDILSLLFLSTFFYGLFNYTFNIVSFPFSISGTVNQIKQSLIFSLKLVIDMMIVTMFYPVDEQLFSASEEEVKNTVIENYSNLEVSLYK